MRVLGGLAKLAIATLLAGVLVAGLMMPYALGLGLAANRVTDTLADTPLDDMTAPPPQTTRITDSAGGLIATLYTQNRTVVPISKISKSLQDAVVAMEDRRFYSTTPGVDWRGTARALLKGPTESGNTQGGSTLTQQYVKNYRLLVLAKTETEKAAAIAPTPLRKLQEAKQALILALKMPKADVLAGYLNLVAFGPSVYGAQAAAQYFFGVNADKLTLSQSALLAAMVNNPNKYNPFKQDRVPDLLKRRDTVLNLMAQYGFITEADRDKAKKEPVGATERRLPNGCLSAANHATYGYFCDYVLSFLRNNQELTATELASSGYVIRTTLVPSAMKAAVDAVRANADPVKNPRVANVIAVVDAPTHNVVALAANRPYGNDKAKGETLFRLPTNFAPLGAGSTFKVFTAAEALKQGLGTSSEIDVPASYVSPLVPGHSFGNSGSYVPRMSVARALATSPNTAFVSLEDQVGLAKVAQTAVDLGLRGYTMEAGEVDRAFAGSGRTYQQEIEAQKMASFTLGVSPVSPLELANVGATIADGGRWCPPNPIESISDVQGGVVQVKLPGSCGEAVKPQLANSLAKAMQGDVESGEGTAHQAAVQSGWELARPAAGKTGTTENYKSSAYLGFTPYYSAAVMTWDYLDRPQSICVGDDRKLAGTCQVQTKTGVRLTGAGTRGMGGGTVPAATWFTAMTPLHKDKSPAQFPPGEYDAAKPELVVPSVRDQDINQATTTLQGLGYQVRTTVAPRSSARPNVVVDQSPAGGSAVLKGATITLTVSAGAVTGG